MSRWNLRFRSNSASVTMSFGSETKVRCWARWSDTSKGSLDLARLALQLYVDCSAEADRIVAFQQNARHLGVCFGEFIEYR